MFFASAFTLGGYGSPVLVESHMYRPTKIEGNDKHPASQGGTDVYAQASILDMYDPDRSQNVMYMGDISTWSALTATLQGPLNSQKAVNGSGIRILSRSFSSPTLADQMQDLIKRFPDAKWHFWEPVNRDNVYAGAQMAFGQPVETVYKLDATDVIVSLDADFLSAGFPGTTRYARDFAKRRDPDSGKMNRLYVIESTPSATGAKADHRLPVRAAEVGSFARALGNAIGLKAGTAPVGDDLAASISSVTKDLQAHRGSSAVLAGDHQPAEIHALVHALNQTLGNVGKTVLYTDPVLASAAEQTDSLKELVSDMRAGKVDLLIILGGNPVYDAPADFGFADALKNTNIPIRVHLGLHQNETAELCQWHVNQAHYLEAWGDTRAYDGTVSIVQPLIAPLYGGKSAHEMISLLAGQPATSGHDIVQNYWKTKHMGADFDMWWRKSLHDGWIDGSSYSPKPLNSRLPDEKSTLATLLVTGTEINFRRDPSIYDGQFSNNGWLQELPKPMSKMTWDNPLQMGPKMAADMGVKSGDMVLVELNGNSMKLPVWIQAGHPDKSVTVFLGYGRQRAGRSGTGQGFDVYPLRYSATPWFTSAGVKVSKAEGSYILASTQGYQTMDVGEDERPLVRTKTLAEYQKDAGNEGFDEDKPTESLYPPYDYKSQPYSWGMAIDLNSCIGCNNCIVACQSENNIAVVGKDQVHRGRHMHWLRVDAYYQGDRDNPKAYFQPVPCMQCENAPCELVCPVGATTHSTEGLNDMVYNRCVGTRYCSNNCPYKVRRFNFLRFSEFDVPQFKMMHNPDVTVRTRGVMEKCTYCVQRINHARIDSETATVREGKDIKIKDGELQTACQQSCPANAIAFGNINDPNSLVSKWKAKSRNYGLLDDLNTRPRTTYLAEIRNPNPELEGSS
jgi:molybdopterin-containing oxidoreductase family iron-sulfur binding subunit